MSTPTEYLVSERQRGMISIVTQNRLNYVQSEIQCALEEVRRFTDYVNASSEDAGKKRELSRSDAMRHLRHARKTLEQLAEHG
jgi:predicted DNA-binding protein (UPF0251 family)